MPGSVLANLREHLSEGSWLSDTTVEKLTVGRDKLIDFLNDRYLQEFIPLGGGKVKLVYGSDGSGKSHFLAEMGRLAKEFGFVVSYLDARHTSLHEFNNLYRAVANVLRPVEMIEALYYEILRDHGFVDEQEKLDEPVVNVWQREETDGLYLPRLKKAIEGVYKDKNLNRSFATAIAQGLGHLSGMHRLTEDEWDALQRWLLGEKLPRRETRSLRIYQKVDRYTGRDMLRSWAHLVTAHLDKKGILILVDNLEVLVGDRQTSYSRGKRDAAYENLRQFIDDVDRASYVFLLLAGGHQVVNDKKRGLYSYPALWQRLQDEISSTRPNRFADLINLDQYPLSTGELRELAILLCTLWKEETGLEEPPPTLVTRRVNEAQAGAGQYAPPGHLVRALLRDFEGRRA